MRKHIFIIGLLLISLSLQAQIKPFFSVGYSSASERMSGLERFAENSKTTFSGGTIIDVKQARRGYNLGFGVHLPTRGDLSPYFRLAGNFSHQSGKAINLSTINVKGVSNVLDISMGLGITSENGAAFYALLGPSFYGTKLEITKYDALNGTYKSSFAKMSYGLGVGYFAESGSGVALDAYCNFKQKPTSKFMTGSSSKKIPENYDQFIVSSQPYNGPYINSAFSYFRFQITLFLSLGKKD
jgi:hypothetical protein